MPMLPSSSSALRQVPAPGSSSKIEATIARPPRPVASCDSDRREVDPEREHPSRGERVQMAPRSAADVEHRPAQRRKQLHVDRVRQADVALERNRERSLPSCSRRRASERACGGHRLAPARPRRAGADGSSRIDAQRRRRSANAGPAGQPRAHRRSCRRRAATAGHGREGAARRSRARCRRQVVSQLMGIPLNTPTPPCLSPTLQ